MLDPPGRASYLGSMPSGAKIRVLIADDEQSLRDILARHLQSLGLEVIEAEDGAVEGREKLMSLHIGLWGRAPPAVGCFAAADLGVALGRERVIHACLLQERLALGWGATVALTGMVAASSRPSGSFSPESTGMRSLPRQIPT